MRADRAPHTPPPRFGEVFRSREFTILWAAGLLSVVGDQLARVALATLVYNRTDSALWAAATYALTFLPAVLGGLLLGQLADRYPRRAVMVSSDLARAALFALMAIPAIPLWLLAVLLFVAVLTSPVHQSAVGALLPEILPGNLYERGLAVRVITDQTAQLAGFAVAGAVLVVLSPSSALLLDAATFVGSALLIVWGVRARPAAAGAGASLVGESAAGSSGGLRAILADPARQVLLAYAWLIGFFVVPEGLAVVHADELGASPGGVAVLMAAVPAGSMVGAWAMAHLVPEQARPRLIGWLAAAAGAPLALTFWSPALPVSAVLWALSGAGAGAYLLQAQATFMRTTPAGERGRALGLANSGIIASQAVGLLVAGVVADQLGSSAAIAGAGVAATAAAGGVAAWASARSAQPSRTAQGRPEGSDSGPGPA